MVGLRRDHVGEAERIVGELEGEILGTGRFRLALVGIERRLLLLLLLLLVLVLVLVGGVVGIGLLDAPAVAGHPLGDAYAGAGGLGVVEGIGHPGALVPVGLGDIDAGGQGGRALERRRDVLPRGGEARHGEMLT